MMQTTSHSHSSSLKVQADGATLFTIKQGSDGDPVVLLHGGPGVPDYLAPVADILTSSHQVIRYDQRGTGRSTCDDDRYDLNVQVEDLECVRVTLGLEQMAIFGHSWGGTLAQLYAQAHPERVTRMFLCNSGIGLGEDWRTMESEVMAYIRRQSGMAGFTVMGLWQLVAMLPGAAGDLGARLHGPGLA